MRRFAFLPILVAVSACGQPAGHDDRESPAAPAPAAPVPAAVAPTAPPDTPRTSRFTSLKSCATVRSEPDEDWAELRCPALAGYSLTLNYADARDDLEVTAPGRPAFQIGLSALRGGGFNALGETAEWRGTDAGGKFVPDALIVRNRAHDKPDTPDRATSYLAVIDLAQGCAVAMVVPGANQNQSARALADGPRQPCLPNP